MLCTFWGIVRDGRIESQEAAGLPEGARLLITVIEDNTLAIRDEGADPGQPIGLVADTDQPRSATFLAEMLDVISRPTQRESAALQFDPDDYPLF